MLPFNELIIWPAIVLAFLCGIQITRRWFLRNHVRQQRQVSEDYFQGINYLLNEEPDKAIEMFIRAIEVDSDTVELHLALGGLFRRKGEIDRATRVHQNVIARPDLSAHHRLQAIYELAQDYDSAGLLDRAENLYRELVEQRDYRARALLGLERVYSREKEWRSAIDVVVLLDRDEKPDLEDALVFYRLELAQEAISEGALEQAESHITRARELKPRSARALYLRGNLSFLREDFAEARSIWQNFCVEFPTLIDEVVVPLTQMANTPENVRQLADFLKSLPAVPKSTDGFEAWLSFLQGEFGREGATQIVLENLRRGDAGVPAAKFLERSSLSEDEGQAALSALLNYEKQQPLQYTCGVCGFQVSAMAWHCRNCGRFETFL